VLFARAASVSFVAVCCLSFGFLVSSGMLNPEVEYLRACDVTAHRGASMSYPENTMAAFRAAREMGADWVELDVQQTSDGVIVVSHDANMKRTCGVNRNVWEMSTAEVAQLDAGSRFSDEFAGERVPTLTEVAAYARTSGLRLNIEIKPTGHETDVERAVIDVVRAEGVADRCVVTSQSYAVLKRVKDLEPDIPTVYVMSIAYGDVTRLTAADHFSVEATSCTRSLVRRVHNAGGQVLAWTCNSEETIERMIDCQVDNVITDDVELARRCVQESRYSDLLGEFLKLIA
jgi:glycerophosphoryl diester phosphodiesterase